jgi:adenylosuccinate synthase
MKKFYCVVGANFGDEGKGLVTDWLAYGKKNCRKEV